jgi:alpha-beta hydrolase superfamily lysophospholipase
MTVCRLPPPRRALLPDVRGLLSSLLVTAALLALPAAEGAGAAAAEPQTLEVVLAERPVVLDLYLPAADAPPRGAVVLAHGFTRNRATLAGHAAALAAQGVIAAVPDLPYATDSRANARVLADLVRWLRSGTQTPAVARVVLVGFSAGGLAALLAADAPGVVGYVGLDPFDRPGGVGRDKAAQLRVPARLIRAPSSACNAFAIAEPWVRALRALEEDRVVEGASHCDFESPTDRLCQWICGATDPARQQEVRAALLEAVSRWLYGPAQAAQR